MQVNLSMYPEDNLYEVETHMLKEGVETVQDVAYLISLFVKAIGYTYVESVAFYDNQGIEVGNSNDLMKIAFSGGSEDQ